MAIFFMPRHLTPPCVCWSSARTGMVWLPDSNKFDDTFSPFDTIPACDRQTDGRTDMLPRHSLRLCRASRSKNCCNHRAQSRHTTRLRQCSLDRPSCLPVTESAVGLERRRAADLRLTTLRPCVRRADQPTLAAHSAAHPV